ncbi:MAG TPA: ABC transporter permease, partial [Chitinophagaceae bacterium]|nr:ABC transporter permease [Chitinophagaceae bacterium]
LALGLAAFWLIALYIKDELGYDRHNKNAGRIFRVVQYASWDNNNLRLAPTSAPFAPALQAAYPEIEQTVRIDLEGGGDIGFNEKKIKANDIIFADKTLFNVFTYDFLDGDAATALSKPNSIVITESLAARIFGSADKATGQTIFFGDNDGSVVTGVIKDLPENSHFRFSGVRALPADYTEGWQNFHIYTYLLLKQGSDYRKLESKLPQFAARTIQKEMGVKNYHLELQPLTSIHLHSNLDFEMSPNGSMSRVYIFIVIAALILIIAMINYMNLATARASARVKEIGIRKTIGSGQWKLAGMFISESVLVTFIAGLVAVCLVQFSLPFFNSLTGKDLYIWRFGKVNILLLFIGFSVITGILSGLYPSLFLARLKTIPSLKGQLGNLGVSILFRKSLVIFQFVVTIVMISGSIIIYRQLRFAEHKDLGFNKEQVLTFHIEDRSIRAQLPALKAQLLRSPLIQGVAGAGNPIGNNDLGGNGYSFENKDGSFSGATKMTQELMVDADFLHTMEIRLMQGRNFSEEMPTDQYGSAIINETLAKELGWTNAIGKHLQFNIDDKGTKGQRTVVGVINDFHTYSLQHKVEPLVMIMPPSDPSKDNLYVRIARGKTTEAIAFLDKVYRQFDSKSPIEYHFLDKNFAKQYSAEEKQGQIALVFTILAVLIACLGLFGLATFTAAQRTKEIGIRKVLGASVHSIVGILSKEFIKLVLIASVIAFPIAWWTMNRWLDDFAYKAPIGAWVFLVAGLLALCIAVITVSFQAIRAALANAVKSLRAE